MKAKSLFRKFTTLCLLFEAYLLLGIARAMIIALPFKKIVRFIGTYGIETSTESNGDENKIKKIAWIVKTAGRFTPWKSTCLAQAMVARQMLHQMGIYGCTIYCGVAKEQKGTLMAHAWLRCGNAMVTGYENNANFTITGIFGDCL